MDWRRVLLWCGLVVVLIGSIALIARVSIMAFGGGQGGTRPAARALANTGADESGRGDKAPTPPQR